MSPFKEQRIRIGREVTREVTCERILGKGAPANLFLRVVIHISKAKVSCHRSDTSVVRELTADHPLPLHLT